jgi:hypothetical protein
VCDNHRECEAARRQGFGGGHGADGRRHGGGHGGHGGGHGHGLEWHGEWRGRELVSTLIEALGVEITVFDAADCITGFSGGDRLFARDDLLLGSSVYGCHGAESRSAVREVLDALRAGSAERSREVSLPDGGAALVQYVARRDADGGYLGALQLARRVR